MEQLIQKYIRYFYITLIGIISIQLFDTTLTTLEGNAPCNTFILMFLSVINLILLVGSLIHNSRQRFTECKANAKILRLTTALLVGLQAFICFNAHPNLISLGNHLMTIIIIEIVLDYRIKSIEHLERLADKLTKEIKDTTPN